MLRARRRWTERGRRGQQYVTFTSALLFAMLIVDMPRSESSVIRYRARPSQKPPEPSMSLAASAEVSKRSTAALWVNDQSLSPVPELPTPLQRQRHRPTIMFEHVEGTIRAVSCCLLHSQHKISFRSPDVLPKHGGDLRMVLLHSSVEDTSVQAPRPAPHSPNGAPETCHFSSHGPATLSNFVELEGLLILPQFVWIPESYSERVRGLSLHRSILLWEYRCMSYSSFNPPSRLGHSLSLIDLI